MKISRKIFIIICFPLVSLLTVLTIHGYKENPNVSDSPSLLLEKSTQVFEPLWTNIIALGDFDDDGDLDAVFSNMGEHGSSVWLNDGKGYFVDSGQRLTTWGHGVGVGDLDGDEDLDLFMTCASYSHRSKVYFNNGKGRFKESGQDLHDASLPGNAVRLIDIDTDGDLDAVVVYYELPDKLYLNDGKGVFTESSTIIPEHATFVDIDSDGDIDIFVKEYGIGYKTMLNNGQGYFSDYWQISEANVTRGGVAFDDLDGDRDVDAFICNGDNSGNNYPATIWLNDGSGKFSDSGQQLNGTSLGKVGLGDLDGNGSIDAFISILGSPNQVWINNGKGYFSDSGLRLRCALTDNTNQVALGDLDNDGDLDIFVANFIDGRNEVWFNRYDKALKIVSWNLLNFSPVFGMDRIEEFQLILDEVDPDILIVQEMESFDAVNLFLSEGLNHSQKLYVKVRFFDGPDTDNAAFYKKKNLKLISTKQIPTSFRDISEYCFKIKKGPGKDTKFRIYSTHFAEGTSPSDKQRRAEEARGLRAYLDGYPSHSPFIICGSLNFIDSNEDGFKILTDDTDDSGGRVIDPLDKLGKWHDKKQFSRLHTQSTRKKAYGDGASGGLDDRFDMILISPVFEDNEKLTYVPGSYLTFGNDGLHLNKAVNKPKNKVVAKKLADALHDASDHLPVMIKLFPYKGNKK